MQPVDGPGCEGLEVLVPDGHQEVEVGACVRDTARDRAADPHGVYSRIRLGRGDRVGQQVGVRRWHRTHPGEHVGIRRLDAGSVVGAHRSASSSSSSSASRR